MFFAIALLILGLGVAYLGARLIGPSSLSRRARRYAWAAFAASWVIVISPALVIWTSRTYGVPEWIWSVDIVAYMALGFLSLVFTLTVMRDLGWTAGRLTRWITRRWRPEPTFSAARRQLFVDGMNTSILGASGVLAGVGYAEARGPAEVERVDVPIPDLPAALDGFRIAQISDVHVGPTIKGDFVRRVVDDVNALDADMVAVTGDIVDGDVPWLAPHVAPLADLKSRHGTFFVTGNHEYYSGVEPWVTEFRRLGLTVLLNEHVVLEHSAIEHSVVEDGTAEPLGPGRLLVAGVTDYRAGRRNKAHRSDPNQALVGAPAHDVKLMLAHQPRSAFAAAKTGFDLQLSGHTHGGQFFPWNLIAGLVHPVLKGLHPVDGMWVYVNRGTGYWGPPVRLMVPPEITLVTLRRA